MDLAEIRKKLVTFLKKNRYAILVLILGILLMNLSGRKPAVPEPPEKETEAVTEKPDLQQQLEAILSRVDGAGAVKVLLTVGEGEKIYYQQDTETNESDENAVSHFVTVVTTDSEKNESGLIHKRVPEAYRGALVLCQGADNSVVKLAVMEAVSKVTGLSTDHICVIKMK